MPGDMWARVYLDVGRSGFPLRCHIGENNISGAETRSDVCRAFVSRWRAKPPPVTDEHGVATVSVLFIVPGSQHDRLMAEAKKRYFREHPDLRPECWDD